MKAALFDLDGVLFNTEPEYDRFWEGICADIMPDKPQMVKAIKGTTLDSTFEIWFSGPMEKYREEVVKRLNAFEATMPFNPVPGALEYVRTLRSNGVMCAVVTSSNLIKMSNVYRSHPYFKDMFHAILTSEDFSASKPSPDCYIKAAAKLNVEPADCVVFEDSINGMKSGRAAKMRVVGIATTLPKKTLRPLSDIQLNDFLEIAGA